MDESKIPDLLDKWLAPAKATAAMFERVAALTNPELALNDVPQRRDDSNVIPLRPTPNHAGDDTINAAWHALQELRDEEHKARLASMTDQERADYDRSERARRAMLDAGWEP